MAWIRYLGANFYLWAFGRCTRFAKQMDSYFHTTSSEAGNVLFNDALNTFYLRLYGRKEGNVLFNDALNTFYLRLYGVRHMINDHSDSERGNPLPPHGLLFPISSKGYLICTHSTDRITHTPTVLSIIMTTYPWGTNRRFRSTWQNGTLAETRKSSVGPPRRIDPTIHRTMSERSCPRS